MNRGKNSASYILSNHTQKLSCSTHLKKETEVMREQKTKAQTKKEQTLR